MRVCGCRRGRAGGEEGMREGGGGDGTDALTPVQRALLQTPGMWSSGMEGAGGVPVPPLASAPPSAFAPLSAFAPPSASASRLAPSSALASASGSPTSLARAGGRREGSSAAVRSLAKSKVGEAHGVAARIQRALGRLEPASGGVAGGAWGSGSEGVGAGAGWDGEAVARRLVEAEEEAQFWSRLAKEEQDECERVRTAMDGEERVWRAKVEALEAAVAEGKAEREALRAEVRSAREEERAHGARRMEMAEELWKQQREERAAMAEEKAAEAGRRWGEQVAERERDAEREREEAAGAIAEARGRCEEAEAALRSARARARDLAEASKAGAARAAQVEAELAGAKAWRARLVEVLDAERMLPWDDLAAKATGEADAAAAEAEARGGAAAAAAAREAGSGSASAASTSSGDEGAEVVEEARWSAWPSGGGRWAQPAGGDGEEDAEVAEGAEMALLRQALSEIKGEYSKLKAWHEGAVLDHAEREAAWLEREKRLTVSVASARADTESARARLLERTEAAGRWEAEVLGLKGALEAAEFSLARARSDASCDAEKLTAFQAGSERRSEEARRAMEETMEKLLGAESRVAALQLALEDERAARKRDAQVASLRAKELEHELALAREREEDASSGLTVGSDKAGELWERLRACELDREGLRGALDEAEEGARVREAEAGHRLDAAEREARSLRERLLALKESGDQRDGLLRAELTQLHAELAEARRAADRSADEVVELGHAVQRARAEHDKAVRAMQGDEDGMQVELGQSRREVKVLEERLAAAAASSDALVGKLRAEVADLEARMLASCKERDDARLDTLEERDRADQAEKRAAAAEKRQAMAEEQAHAAQQSSRAVQEGARQLEVERDRLRVEVSALEDKVAGLSLELRHKEATGYNVEQLLSDRAEALARNSKRSSDEVEANSQLQTLVRALEYERDDVRRELHAERTEHVRTRGKVDKAHAELVNYREALARAERELRRSLEAEEEAKLQILGLSQELSVVEATEHSESDQRHLGLARENGRLRGRLQELEGSLYEARGEAVQARRDLETALEEAELLRGRLGQQKDLDDRGLADLRRMNRHLREELEAAQQVVAQAAAAAAANEDELLQTRQLGQSLHSEANLLKDRVDRAHAAQVTSLEGALQDLRARLERCEFERDEATAAAGAEAERRALADREARAAHAALAREFNSLKARMQSADDAGGGAVTPRSPTTRHAPAAADEEADEEADPDGLGEIRRATLSHNSSDWLAEEDLSAATASASKLLLEGDGLQEGSAELEEARREIVYLVAQLREAKAVAAREATGRDKAGEGLGSHPDDSRALGEALAREKVANQELADELRAARERLRVLEGEMRLVRAEAASDDLAQMRAGDLARASTMVEDVEARVAALKGEHAEALSRAAAEHAEAVGERDRELAALAGRLSEAESAWSAERVALQSEIERSAGAQAGELKSRGELADLERSLDAYKRQVTDLGKELSEATDALAAIMQERNGLEVKCRAAEQARAAADVDMASARGEAARLKERLEALRADKEAMQADLDSVKADAGETVGTLRSMLSEMDHVQRALGRAEAERNELSAALAEARDLLAQERTGASGLQDNEVRLQRMLEAARDEAALQAKRLSAAEDEHRSAIEAVRSECEAYIKEKRRAAAAKLKESQEALGAEIREAREQLQGERQARERAASELAEARDLAARAEEKHAREREELGAAVSSHKQALASATAAWEAQKDQLQREAEAKVRHEVEELKKSHAHEREKETMSRDASREQLRREAEERLQREVDGLKRSHAEALDRAKATWDASKEQLRREAEERLRRTLDEQQRGHAAALERAEKAREAIQQKLARDAEALHAQGEEAKRRHAAEMERAEKAWEVTREHMRKDAAEALHKAEMARGEIVRRADDAHHKAIQREEGAHAATRASLARAEAEAEGLRAQLQKAQDEARRARQQEDLAVAQADQESKGRRLCKEELDEQAREVRVARAAAERTEVEAEALRASIKAKADRCSELEGKVASLEVELRESEATVSRQRVQLASAEFKQEDLRQRARADFSFLTGVSSGLEERLKGCLARLRSVEGMGDLGGSRERAVAREVACKALRKTVERFLEDFKQTWKKVTDTSGDGGGSLETLAHRQAEVGRTLAGVSERVGETEAALAELLIEYSVSTPQAGAGGRRARRRPHARGADGLDDDDDEDDGQDGDGGSDGFESHGDVEERSLRGEREASSYPSHAHRLEARHCALLDQAVSLRRELHTLLEAGAPGTPYDALATPGGGWSAPTPATGPMGADDLRIKASKAYADRAALLHELESVRKREAAAAGGWAGGTYYDDSPRPLATPESLHRRLDKPLPDLVVGTPAGRRPKPGDEFRWL